MWKRPHLFHCLVTTAPYPVAADNNIGDEGAEALGAALEPKQNPDGTWVFNTALSTLELGGAAQAPLALHKGDPCV